MQWPPDFSILKFECFSGGGSLTFTPSNWSTAWIHDAKITALASDQVSGPAAETFVFYYPASGVTYRAHAIGRFQKDIDALKEKKDTLDPARYDQEMEKLLTNLALKTKAIREREDKK